MVQKKENLRRMLEGQPHEHIPVSFFQHLKPEELHGEACVKAHIRFYKQTDPDFLKIMHDGLTAPVDLGLTSLEELKAYRPIKGQNPYIREYLERALRINESLADETDTYSNIFSPFTLLRRIGDDRLLGFLREDPQAVKDALLFMGEDLAYLSEKLIQEAGCLGIFLAMQGAENGLFTPEEFADYIAPSEQLVLSAAQESSPYNILHFCGWNQIKNQLELWRDYPGNTVNWAVYVEQLPLAEGRKYFGMRNCMGGFDNRRGKLLYSGTKEEIRRETTNILETYRNAFGSTDGLILGKGKKDGQNFGPVKRIRYSLRITAGRKWRRILLFCVIGSIPGILFDNDTSVIAEGLGIAPYYFVKIPVKAGQGMKTGLQCNIQYAGFRTR